MKHEIDDDAFNVKTERLSLLDIGNGSNSYDPTDAFQKSPVVRILSVWSSIYDINCIRYLIYHCLKIL